MSDRLVDGALVTVASGRGHEGAVHLHQAGAAMHVARLGAGDPVEVPAAPFVHVYVARGAVELDGRRLGTGDAARLTDAGVVTVVATEPAEVVVWETDSVAHR